jgi:hypothetical protein
VLLVVENSDTFDTLHCALANDPGPVGYIARGAGAAFEASVASVADLPQVITVAYFGDLDADGRRIPASAAALAELDGLPPARPATSLYELLLTAGVPQPGQPAVSLEKAGALTMWLAAPHRERVRQLLTGGARLPQETVTARRLATCPGWRHGLADSRAEL